MFDSNKLHMFGCLVDFTASQLFKGNLTPSCFHAIIWFQFVYDNNHL